MTTDATDLLNKYGSRLAVAEAYLSGKIDEKKDIVFELITQDEFRAVRVSMWMTATVEWIHNAIFPPIK